MSIFNTVTFRKPKRSLFNLSHEVRFSAKFGQLIPFFCKEVVPGDTFQVTTEMMARAMPMTAPLMHRVNLFTHFFFVPNRLVWDQWQEFITGGEDGNSTPPFPRCLVYTDTPGSLPDFLGVGVFPRSDSRRTTTYVNALPFRAYSLIWNEYYRDQNLQEELEISKESGIDNTVNRENLLLRNWEKDYFTSALPWTQRGTEAIAPLRGENEVLLRTDSDGSAVDYAKLRYTGSPSAVGESSQMPGGYVDVQYGGALSISEDANNPAVALDPNGTLYTNMEGSFYSINELRRALALQRWLEANARGGSRYIEQIYSHFGVKSSDARLQRPQFLGGGIVPLRISEVLQTSSSTANSDLGDMAGHGMAVGTTREFRRFFEEHGFIIGICSILPRTSYAQGTQRVMQKFDRFDYYFPEFAHLGEQEVWNSEVFQGASSTDIGALSGIFGYQSRYAEYKYYPNTVHGDLKTSGFENWTLYRKFASKPALNSEFIDVNSDEEELGRIFPVKEGEDGQFIVQMFNRVKAVRPMPKHTIPGL